MFTVVNSQILNGDLLPNKEALIRYRETKTEPMLDRYRLSDHNWMKDFHRRKGFVIHSSELIYRIQALNPNVKVQYQMNYEQDWGLYIPLGRKLTYVSSVPKGWLTEFSYLLVDDRDLPEFERRGWRTVLIRLMGKGVLTWEQVEAEFGSSEGVNADRWLIYTRSYRNLNASKVVQLNQANEARI